MSPSSLTTPDVDRLLAALSRRPGDRLTLVGGYVICSCHSIIDSVPPENHLAL